MNKPSFIKSYKGHIVNKVHIQGYIDMPYGDLYIDDFIFSVNKDIYYLYATGSEVEIEYEEHHNKLFDVTHHSLYSIKNTGKNKYDGIETYLIESPYEEDELNMLNRMNKFYKHIGWGIFCDIVLSVFLLLIVKLIWKESITNQYLFIGIASVFVFSTVFIAGRSRKRVSQLLQIGKKKVIKMRIEEHSVEKETNRSEPAHDYIIGIYGTENNKISIQHQNYLYKKNDSHLIFHLTMDDMLLAIYDTDMQVIFKRDKF